MKTWVLTLFVVITLFFLSFTSDSKAQVPEPAYNPMTAPGAKGIHWNSHTLYWQNSSGTIFNEVYFSDDSVLVANMDSSVGVRNGYPSTVYSSYPLSDFGNLDINKKYFWRVVEYNSFGNSISTIWSFKSQGPIHAGGFWNFDSGLEGWQIIGPLGLTNWYWTNATHTGSTPGEIVFRWDPVFIGDSYIMSPEISSAAGVYSVIDFRYYEDWWADTVIVGCAITTDNGATWNTIWDLYATGNVGPDNGFAGFEVPGDFRLGFFYKGNSDNIDFLYVDNVIVSSVLSPPIAPKFLTATANDSIKKVNLNWDEGMGAGGGVTSYIVQRKNGTPSSQDSFTTIATVGPSILTYDDFDVELNQTYTYRVRTYSIPGASSYGNEATAYVPEIVPVELVSFNANVFEAGVSLNWITATEINNRGFEVEKREVGGRQLAIGNTEWKIIGFVEGRGTTTQTQSYSFVDEEVTSGRYQYRLKQIDFDGSYEYSSTVEVDVNLIKEFVLEQNYPNPFNPTTKISWQSPVGSHQTIKVYDVLGNEVATLVDEYREAGKYEIEFEASNLSSGVYYYQLRAGSFVETRRMIILK